MSLSRRTVLTAGLGVAAVAATASPAIASGGSRPAHVILVDWDGFDPSYLYRTRTPNLFGLARRGSLSIADGTFHTVSNPSRASMSTGAYPEIHGNAAYVFDPETNRAHGQTRFLAAETIAEALAAEGKTMASVQWYMVQNHGVIYGDPEHLYVQPGGPFAARVDAAIEILNGRPVDSNGEPVTVPRIPDFLAVYSSDLDGLGHREGPNSPNIGPTLAEHDRQLGRLVQATKDVGIYEQTTFILTSDHGMTGWTRTLIPDVLQLLAGHGHRPEVVTPGNAPAAETDIIIVPNAVRQAHITLRGEALDRVSDIAAALRQHPKISRVLDRDDLRTLHASQKLGDLVAEAKPPHAFALGDPPAGERGSHGSLREIKVPLLIAGAGIRMGVRPRQPVLVDIAPTISALLGIRPPADAQGRVLSEVITVGDLG